ncbi:hypothetical protein GCM10027596_03340 [Nocardioides korecus]
MCGACGSGTVGAPWEIASHGAGPRLLAARAAEAEALLGRPWRVGAFGPAGYPVRSPTGAATVHRDLDDLLARLLAVAPDGVRRRAVEAADRSFVARAFLARDD